ncbi:MAG TPA: hypothetical protein VKT49_12905 [Bryobacteraceae bacterium]|nr:hypothetical protein [Bryobacteraceae bacterium]
MRLVLKDENDTLELNLVDSQWFAEAGSPVQIESLLTDDAGLVNQIWSEARPRVFTVGN